MQIDQLRLVWPATEYLPSFMDALATGWSPNAGLAGSAADELEEIRRDPAAFLALQVDREGRGPPLVLGDGTIVPRLPGFRRWLWDGEFCGAISFRRQPGTTDLPPTCLGHIGYSVVPWKRQRGYATRALALLLDDLREEEEIAFVEITTDVDNIPSRRVIEANQGRLVDQFEKAACHGSGQALRYRIPLGSS